MPFKLKVFIIIYVVQGPRTRKIGTKEENGLIKNTAQFLMSNIVAQKITSDEQHGSYKGTVGKDSNLFSYRSSKKN